MNNLKYDPESSIQDADLETIELIREARHTRELINSGNCPHSHTGPLNQEEYVRTRKGKFTCYECNKVWESCERRDIDCFGEVLPLTKKINDLSETKPATAAMVRDMVDALKKGGGKISPDPEVDRCERCGEETHNILVGDEVYRNCPDCGPSITQ